MAGYPKWVFALALAIVAGYLNYWLWDDARIVLGLPINLLYHVILSIGLVPLMLLIVERAWPSYLSDD